MTYIIAISVGLLIIAILGVYAGRLMFKLQQQQARQKAAREARIETIIESIHTIARAMSQQQCNVSEGTIRICRLFRALPEERVDYSGPFPAIHSLFEKVNGFAILAERQALSKAQRLAEDKAREEIEVQFESTVLKELPKIVTHCEQRQPALKERISL